MPYRGMDTGRMILQTDTILDAVGQSMVWRHLASANSGNPDVGIGPTYWWRETVITGAIVPVPTIEQPSPAGALMAGEMGLVTREPLRATDEIIWRGDTYQVHGEPYHSRHLYVSKITRSD